METLSYVSCLLLWPLLLMLNLTKKQLKKIKQQKLRNKENVSLISSIELKENWSWYKKWFSYKKMCIFQKIIFLIEEAKYVKELNNVFNSDYLWHQSCQKEMFKLRWLRCKIVAPAQNRAVPIYSISHLIFNKQGLLEMNRFPWIAPFLKNPNVQLVLLTDPRFNFGFLKTSNHCVIYLNHLTDLANPVPHAWQHAQTEYRLSTFLVPLVLFCFSVFYYSSGNLSVFKPF